MSSRLELIYNVRQKITIHERERESVSLQKEEIEEVIKNGNSMV